MRDPIHFSVKILSHAVSNTIHYLALPYSLQTTTSACFCSHTVPKMFKSAKNAWGIKKDAQKKPQTNTTENNNKKKCIVFECKEHH